MDERISYLFVYGTLLHDDNEFAVYLKQYSTFYSEGKFKGRLYDIGAYPGAILQTDSDEWVYGTIFKIDNQDIVLKVLDDYEGFGEDQPHPNEFIRELVKVKIDNSLINCWVYLYNLPIEHFQLIKHAKYFK